MTETISQFAARHNVSRRTVGRWEQRGFIVRAGGLVDGRASDARLAERPSVYRGGRARGPADSASGREDGGADRAELERGQG